MRGDLWTFDLVGASEETESHGARLAVILNLTEPSSSPEPVTYVYQRPRLQLHGGPEVDFDARR